MNAGWSFRVPFLQRVERLEDGDVVVEELPDRQQEILRLKFQGGLSYKEIADVMDLTISHVGVLIHNAKFVQ